ncbi:hypothetical protein DERF_011271 [Dermatophagoides farinae]|uniref:Uncharacterized protein n=1 Tax=Dermatophagoides farinae TaxID=6954 RepID=A0A922L2X5_DERFA|nr:hypothetical protein DERF_011271 [Dermatophagoides farinae]
MKVKLISISLTCLVNFIHLVASNPPIQARENFCHDDSKCPGFQICENYICQDVSFNHTSKHDGLVLEGTLFLLVVILGSILNCVIYCFACIGCYHCCCETRAPKYPVQIIQPHGEMI